MNQMNCLLTTQINQDNNNMNPISPNNNNNNNNYNLDLNPKLKKLVKEIIKFYHSNNNKNMNLNNQKQINSLLNNLNPNYPGLHQGYYNNIKNPLPYMKEEKIIIKFINSDYEIINVKIPKDITKIDFYSIAKLYKVFYFTNMILIHNENILDNDDSSIDEIKEGDNIIIIEDRDYPDDSYYNYLQQKYKGTNKINIEFKLENSGLAQLISLSKEVTIFEMIKAYNLRNGLNNKNIKYRFNGKTINPNDETKIGEKYLNNDRIKVHQVFTSLNFYIIGRKIKAKSKINGERIERTIGKLNSIQLLFSSNFFGVYIKNNEKIYIGKNIIKKGDDDISFFSLGIKNDFDFVIK